MIKKRVSIKKILALLVLFPSLSAHQFSTDPKKTTIVKHGEDDRMQELAKLAKNLLTKNGTEEHITVKDGNISISIKYGQDCQDHVTFKNAAIVAVIALLVGMSAGAAGRRGYRCD